MTLISYISQHTQLSEKNITNTVQLLNEDCTIPFIARYRKERTGNLNEVEIGEIAKFKSQFVALQKRKEAIIKVVDEQGALTAELKIKFESAPNSITLEDLYLPYKKSKKTKAEVARKNGLEPLAKIIMAQRQDNIDFIAHNYLSDAVPNEDDALEGARHIISEWVNERTDIRNQLRNQLERHAILVTKVVTIQRAEKEGVIRLKIEIDEERALEYIERRLIKSTNECTLHIEQAIADAYKRLLFPSLSNELLKKAKEKADAEAIAVFAKNLKQLLLGAPLGEKRILAIDPGFRTGCKVVCLDAQGNLKHNETIYPHPPQNNSTAAIKKISSLADAYKIEAIAIGNGTASRETERLIKRIAFKNSIEVFVVSEAGASIYSASKIAREEFPNYDVTVRGAVSIGRRLADPLAELVKIDAKSIGVGQYQHDVDQTQLKTSLDTVVESCVNAVGVNINTASVSLLSYVSGIGSKLAENIVAYRKQNGPFENREAIKKVPRLGGKAFEQGAGFLRIKEGDNPLDDSAVHPESYGIVKKMAKDQGIGLSDIIKNKTVIARIELESYKTKRIGLPTLQDIVKELEKPGLDQREKAKVFTFDQNVKNITDLREGQLLPGIINNITNFGCFVDIGIKESGLIHISNLADGFVSDVNAHVSLQQQLIVKVLSVDIERKRIQLKLHKG